MTDLPNPLVPASVDLRDFAFMPLEVNRLRKSKAWLWAKKQPELGFYMINLWGGSWHESPAASLEDDDDVLADMAMCTSKRWAAVREKVLHGWIKCSDGRLYHPVVAEKALEAWEAKCKQRKRTQAATEARVFKKTIVRASDEVRNEDRDEKRDDDRNDRRDDNVTFTKGQGRDREGTGNIPSSLRSDGRREDATPALPGLPPPLAKAEKIDPWKAVYDRGKAVLGPNSGGLITNLKKLYDGKISKVMAKIEDANEHRDPIEWLTAFLWKVNDDGKLSGEYIGGVPP